MEQHPLRAWYGQYVAPGLLAFLWPYNFLATPARSSKGSGETSQAINFRRVGEIPKDGGHMNVDDPGERRSLVQA